MAFASILTFCAACVAPFIGSAHAQTPGEMKPIAVVALSSIDELMEDTNFVGSLAGMPQLAQMVQPQVVGMTPGLDHSRPIGAIVQSDGVTPGGAICLPVTDLKQLLAMSQMFLGATFEQDADGIYEITAKDQTLFAREAGGWAYLSMMPQMLEGLPDNPGELFEKLTKDYDLGIRLNVQNIPEAYRQMFLEQMRAGIEMGMIQLPEESDENFQTRQDVTKLQLEQMERAIKEIDQLTFGLSVDREQQRAFFDFLYTALPDTRLAEQLALNSDPKTDYAGFFQPDAAMMMSFTSKIAEADIAQADQMFEAFRMQMKTAMAEVEDELPSDEAREIADEAVNNFLDAIVASFKAGVMDGGAVVHLAPNSLTMVAGGFVAEPAKVESGLKKLAEIAKDEPDFPGINWNAESHGDVQFHTLTAPIPDSEPEAHQLFGDNIEMVVGIGTKSVYFALGRDCLDAVKQVIDASAAEPQKSVPPMEMTLSLKKIMDVAVAFADEEDQDNLRMIADMLGQDATGRDHVRMVVQPIPNGVRIRTEAEEGVLRAIGMGVMQEMQKSGQGGF